MIDVTVVVPTRDRPELLRRCLAALAGQRSAELEILVVDDGSRRAREVAGAISGAPGARLLRQAPRGAAAARNTGAHAAAAPVVCFTDDDCEPAPDWAARLAAALGQGADAAAGKTIEGSGSPFAAASQAIADHLAAALRAAGRAPFAPSSNLACRTEMLHAVPFDESYPGSGAEDRDFCLRLAGAGYDLVSVPEAIVVHRPELTLRTFVAQHVRYGRGAYRLRRTHPSQRRLEPPGFYGGLLRSGVHRGAGAGFLVGVAQVATAAGFLRESLVRGGPAR